MTAWLKVVPWVLLFCLMGFAASAQDAARDFPREEAGGSLPEAVIAVPAGDTATLIAAINTANSSPDPSSTIQLAGGTYTLTAPDNGTWGPTGLPAIVKTLVIEGNGATISRDAAAPKLRFFTVNSGATLTLRNLTLSGGLSNGGNGGGGRFGAGGGAGLGGAIFNRGTLVAENCSFAGNAATGGAGSTPLFTAYSSGGGGGMGGDGGGVGDYVDGGGGGGGWMGNGGAAGLGGLIHCAGGGGGGTLVGAAGNGGTGSFAGSDCVAGAGGQNNGGSGGIWDGSPGGLGGGGGGGGGRCPASGQVGGNGGAGGDGGGGGGGGWGFLQYHNGGNGGFGGGGGAFTNSSYTPGWGGFGGGGSAGGGSAFAGGSSSSCSGAGGAGMGGAIFNYGGAITLTECALTGNSAAGGTPGAPSACIGSASAGAGIGGGLFNLNGSVTVINGTVTSNTASTHGTALYNLTWGAGAPTATLTLTGSLATDIVNNSASLTLTMDGSDPTNIISNGIESYGSATQTGTAEPTCLPGTYLDIAGICGGHLPCYKSLGRCYGMVCDGGSISASGGRYGDTLTLVRNLTLNLGGDIEFSGTVSQSAGTVNANGWTLTTRGDLVQTGGTFTGGTMAFLGTGKQVIGGSGTVSLNNLVIDSPLSGWWTLNEGSGELARDSTGKGHDGAFFGGPTWVTSGLPPVPYTNPAALSFDGMDDSVRGSAASLPTGQSPMTVLAWIKTTFWDRQTIFSYGSSETNRAVSLDTGQVYGWNGRFCVDFYGNALQAWNGSTINDVNDGQWHLVGFTLAGGTKAITLYVDGVAQAATLSSVPDVAAGTDFQVGRWVTAGGGDTLPYPFHGAIDDVRVYGTVLSATDIKAVYDGGLAGHWKLDEGTGSTTADSTANAETGYLQGSPTWLTGGLPPVSPFNPAALSFSGSGDYVAGYASYLPQGADPMTVLAWIKTTSTARQTAFSYGWAAPNNAVTLDVSQVAPNGHFYVDFYSNYLDSGVTVNDGNWHHVGFSLAGGTTAITMFVDGRAYPGTLASVPEVWPSFFCIARWLEAGPSGGDKNPYFFAGAVDDVRVYRRELSPAEVAELAAGGNPAPSKNWVGLDRPLHLGGDLEILSPLSILDTGGGNQSITVDGNWTTLPGTFLPRSGSVTFGGSGAQVLTGDTALYDLTVGSGSTLTTSSRVTVGGTLTNLGWTDETKAVTGIGSKTWGLAGITTDVTTQGFLSSLRVRRRDQDHPYAPASLQTGKYWNIAPAGSGFGVSLTLPQAGLPDPQVCRYESGAWDWARTSFTSATVTRNGVTAFSDWTVGNGVPSPPPVGDGTNGTAAANFSKHSQSSAQIDVTFDASHCAGQKAVILYGAIGNFSGYTGTAQCGGGDTGSTTIDSTGMSNVWFNILWENGTVAGHPGYAFGGTANEARTWPSIGRCDIATDQQDYGNCP